MSQTAEQLIRDIEDMKVKGAYLITRVALEALTLLARDQPDLAALDPAAARLQKAQPSMASVANGCDYVLHSLRQPDSGIGAGQVADLIEQRSHEFLDALDRAQQQVEVVGARLLHDGDVVFVHSYTGTLVGIFRRARVAGTRFSVISTESRPYCEGRYLVGELIKLGIPCTQITDASIASFVGRANKSMVGIDSILSNGAVVNKMGTHLLGMACRAYGVPLYAAGSIFKLSMASLRGDEVKMLRRGDDGAIGPVGVADAALLSVENQIFDTTPPHLIEALVTDQGVLPPAAIAGFREHPMLLGSLI